MRRKSLIIAICSVLSVANAIAQDVLYFKDGTKQACQILAVDGQKTSFKSIDNINGPTYTKANNQLLLAFKDNGKYLIMQGDTDGPVETSDFFTRPVDRAYDILITKDDEVIPGNILSVTEEKFNYKNITDLNGATAALDKSNVAAIIYRNGKHQLYISTTEAVYKLALVKDKVDLLISRVENQQVEQADLSNTASAGDTGSVKIELSKAEMERFRLKANEKTDRFGKYIALIADKETERDDANKAVDAACGLFLSDSSRVEVSNVNSEKKEKRFVREYLRLLRMLPYDEVIVTWTEISYVSDLKKGADGNYYGNITFQQVFEGYTDGKPMYRDVTEKRVEVVLKSYAKQVEGKKIELWDVFLSNVGVEETMSK